MKVTSLIQHASYICIEVEGTHHGKIIVLNQARGKAQVEEKSYLSAVVRITNILMIPM